MNITELETEIKTLNQQIKNIQAEGEAVWQQVAEVEGKIALIHNNRQTQLQALKVAESQLIDTLALGQSGDEIADKLLRLKTITKIPVEKITESLETEKETLRKQQSQILKQANPIKKRIKELENAIEARKRFEQGDSMRDVTSWLHHDKRLMPLEVDELLKLVA